MEQFEGIMELFDLKVRRLRNGNKLRLEFESPEDLEMEAQLIHFRGHNVKAVITHEQEPEKKKDIVFIEDTFEVFDLKCRRLRNGDKLNLVIEQMYDKDKELAAVKLRYQNCKLFFEKEQKELDLEADEKNEDYEV